MTRELHCYCQVAKLCLVITPLMTAVLVFWIVIYLPPLKASVHLKMYVEILGALSWSLFGLAQSDKVRIFPINLCFVPWNSLSSIYFLVLIRICPVVLVTSCTKVTYLDPAASQSIKLLVPPPRIVFAFSSENEQNLHCLSYGCRVVLSSGGCRIHLFSIWAFWATLLISMNIPICSHGERCTF